MTLTLTSTCNVCSASAVTWDSDYGGYGVDIFGRLAVCALFGHGKLLGKWISELGWGLRQMRARTSMLYTIVLDF